MPKLVCPCGYVHDLSSIPDDGWITVRDQDYEKLIDAEIRRNQISASEYGLRNENPQIEEYDQQTRTVTSLWGRLYECPTCGRIMWQRERAGEYRIFRPDKEQAEIEICIFGQHRPRARCTAALFRWLRYH